MSQCVVTSETLKCLDPILPPVLSNIVTGYLEGLCEVKLRTIEDQDTPVVHIHDCVVDGCPNENYIIIQDRSSKIKAYFTLSKEERTVPRPDGNYWADVKYVVSLTSYYQIHADKKMTTKQWPPYWFQFELNDQPENQKYQIKSYFDPWISQYLGSLG
jgi:hypothetical protein